MNKSDLLRMSWQNLLRRKTRSILTVVGVMIGTASIVIMLSLGLAMDRQFQEQISQMGSLNIIDVQPSYGGGYGMEKPGTSSQSVFLNDQAVAQFEKISGVEAVMPQKTSYFKVVAGKMVGHVGVIGVKPDHLDAFDFEVETGRLLIAGDKEAVIFGSQIAYNFYNPRLSNRYYGGPRWDAPPEVNLVSDKLLLTANMQYGERVQGGTDPDYKPPKLHDIKGVGILKQSNNEKDYNAYMNIAHLEKILEEDRKNDRSNGIERNDMTNQHQYDTIKVKCKNIEVVTAVQEKIKELGFMAYSLTDILESMKKTSRTMQAILGGIGAISLLVAAIGITNTMIMSIYERTREIGIIKVLGADIADIKRLFLLEAALIGLSGGVIGLLLSYAVSGVLNNFVPGMMGGMADTSISYIPPVLAIGALVFSTMVGIVAGYSPARRAMNLSALDAIRTE